MVIHAPERRSLFFWPIFIAGLIAVVVLPIGIHTVMLDYIGIPYPAALPRTGWAAVPDRALIVLGVLYLNAQLAQAPSLSLVGRYGFLFLTVAAINQALFRLPIMLNAVSTKWTIFPFIDNLPAVLTFAAMVALALAVAHRARTAPGKVVAAVVIAAVTNLIVAPALHAAFAGIIAADAHREGDQLYNVPYDWHVDLPSYLTFLEPALGALAVAAILNRLGLRPLVVATVIFALQGGPLFRLLLNVFYAPQSPGVALLSEGQFTLEAIALASLASALGWFCFARRTEAAG